MNSVEHVILEIRSLGLPGLGAMIEAIARGYALQPAVLDVAEVVILSDDPPSEMRDRMQRAIGSFRAREPGADKADLDLVAKRILQLNESRANAESVLYMPTSSTIHPGLFWSTGGWGNFESATAYAEVSPDHPAIQSGAMSVSRGLAIGLATPQRGGEKLIQAELDALNEVIARAGMIEGLQTISATCSGSGGELSEWSLDVTPPHLAAELPLEVSDACGLAFDAVVGRLFPNFEDEDGGAATFHVDVARGALTLSHQCFMERTEHEAEKHVQIAEVLSSTRDASIIADAQKAFEHAHRFGARRYELEYAGAGDNGDKWDSSFYDDSGYVEVPNSHVSSTRDGTAVVIQTEAAVERLTEKLLYQLHDGYENGSAAGGTLTIDLNGGAVESATISRWYVESYSDLSVIRFAPLREQTAIDARISRPRP
ncbi:hypothetical protein [Achromobacter anxifer]|uniref:hypothetical protein n=1 Tax=Achromobacter anxifer TaxID=1287737 RepID=UPI0023F929EA|nr:hypothetical protein [Achromobacter anxifer]MDF8364683.1 hypothetical protein [Achromobacter anxifer]